MHQWKFNYVVMVKGSWFCHMEAARAMSQHELAITVQSQDPAEQSTDRDKQEMSCYEHRIIHHHRSADTPQKTSNTSGLSPLLIRTIPHAHQQKQRGQSVSWNIFTASYHRSCCAACLSKHKSLWPQPFILNNLPGLGSVTSSTFCVFPLHGLCVVI